MNRDEMLAVNKVWPPVHTGVLLQAFQKESARGQWNPGLFAEYYQWINEKDGEKPRVINH